MMKRKRNEKYLLIYLYMCVLLDGPFIKIYFASVDETPPARRWPRRGRPRPLTDGEAAPAPQSEGGAVPAPAGRVGGGFRARRPGGRRSRARRSRRRRSPCRRPSRPSWITAPKLPASMPASANMDGYAPRSAPANDRAPTGFRPVSSARPT
jgi:hypothetical protein